ncbi:MAG TPA: GxxExxY protein [Acidobacteriota bacterium]|jgi:GxxExxY protein
MTPDDMAREIVDSAIKVHRALGPGLLESAYQSCLAYELRRRGYRVDCEVPVPLEYDGSKIDVAYRLDLLVEQSVIVEIKACEGILPIHLAQVLTYLKLRKLTLGFILNFNVKLLKQGIKRVVSKHQNSNCLQDGNNED